MPLDIGIPELVLVMVVVLMVFGPSRMPELARGLGTFVRDMRAIATSFTSEFMDETKPAASPPMPQRSCPHCTALNPLSNKFCSQCGGNLIV